MPVTRIRDPKRVFASLSLEPERSATLSAFLGTFGPGDGAWAWRAGGATNISFVVHLTRSPCSPILLGYGPPAGIENLLFAALPELPERFLLLFPVEHQEALTRVFTMDVRPHTLLSLARADLAEMDRKIRPAELDERDRNEVEHLLGGDTARGLRCVPTSAGIALGVRKAGRLIAAALAPVVSHEYRRAFVEDVVTLSGRGRTGIAAQLHVALACRLFGEGIEVIGAVLPDEDAAGRALLASLGYRPFGHVLLGSAVLRGGRGAGGPPSSPSPIPHLTRSSAEE